MIISFNRVLISFGVLTVMLLMAYYYQSSIEQASSGSSQTGTLFFSPLTGQLEDIASIEIITNTSDLDQGDQINQSLLSFKKNEEGAWVVHNKSNFPVAGEKIRAFVLALAGSKIVEPKTSNPNLYKKINVQALQISDSEAVQVIIKNRDNEVIVNTLLGRSEEAVGRLFVRDAMEAQSWLIESDVHVDTTFQEWVKQPLIELPEQQIQKIILVPSSKLNKTPQARIISKLKPADVNYSISGVQIKDKQFEIDDVAANLSYLRFLDVKRTDEDISKKFEPELTLSYQLFNEAEQKTLVLGKLDKHYFVKLKDKAQWLFEISVDQYEALTLAGLNVKRS